MNKICFSLALALLVIFPSFKNADSQEAPRREVVIFVGGGNTKLEGFRKAGETIQGVARTAGLPVTLHVSTTGQEIVRAMNGWNPAIHRIVFFLTHSDSGSDGGSLVVNFEAFSVEWPDGTQTSFDAVSVDLTGFIPETAPGLYLRPERGLYDGRFPDHPKEGSAKIQDIRRAILQNMDVVLLGCNTDGLAQSFVRQGARSAYGNHSGSDFFAVTRSADAMSHARITPERPIQPADSVYLIPNSASIYTRDPEGHVRATRRERGLQNIVELQESLLEPTS